jgi:hypothetical protein
MRLGTLLLLLLAVIFGSWYWYQIFNQECKTPVYYRIGTIDERFGTSKDELRRIAKNAESLWEEDLAEDLFVYTEDGKLPINLVFDERQQNANIEEELREDLESKEGMSSDVAAQYERLITEFRALKINYEAKVVTYETELKKYNTTVEGWNDRGGAPPEEVIILKEEQERLSLTQESLENRAKELNKLASQLNFIGAKGNTLITDYNKIVEKYNAQFSESHEYTQGDHSIEAINIYQFNTEEELTLVLAHEMGHALSLGHIANERSIMYRLMGAQQTDFGLSPEDIDEFKRVCEAQSTPHTLFSFVWNLF